MNGFSDAPGLPMHGLAFVGHGSLRSYMCSLVGAMGQLAEAYPITYVGPVDEEGTIPSDTFVVVNPSCRGDAPQRNAIEKKILETVSSCALVIDGIRNIPEAGYLIPKLRIKVKIIIMRGSKSDVADKVIGLLFPHLTGDNIVFNAGLRNIKFVAHRVVVAALDGG